MLSRVLVLMAAAALAAAGAGAAADPPARVVLVSFDGLADWIVDRLIDEGQAPALVQMARDGARAEAMVTVVPTLTAPGHATLWTGAWPRRHGVVSNAMPRTPPAAHSLLESQSGFLSPPLSAEPIWHAAARAGRRVLVMQASGGYPFSGAYPDRLTQFDAYGERLLFSELIDTALTDRPTAFRVGQTEARLWREGSGLRLRVGDAEASLEPDAAPYSPPFAVRVGGRDGHVRFLLIALEPPGGRVILSRGEVRAVVSTHPALVPQLVAEAGTPLGEYAGTPYHHGRFGPTMAEGGDGRAERAFARAIAANHEYFEGALRFASLRPWDLLVLYVSSMDTAGHALAGMLDPDAPGHDPDLARRVWPIYTELFRRCVDEYVEDLRRRLPDAAIVIAADHGMEGARRVWHPNVVLREAGLLAERDGRPDLARTKALFLYANDGGIYLNAVRYRGGVVTDDQRRGVKEAATRALLSARDPANGGPLVRAVLDPERDGEALGVGGTSAPDLYFDPMPGYETRATFGAAHLVIDTPPTGVGLHGPFPTRRRLHAAFFAVGPGVRPGVRPGLVRAVDVAPTVAALLGIPPPADADGRPVPLE